jgi:hypothetical protein
VLRVRSQNRKTISEETALLAVLLTVLLLTPLASAAQRMQSGHDRCDGVRRRSEWDV